RGMQERKWKKNKNPKKETENENNVVSLQSQATNPCSICPDLSWVAANPYSFFANVYQISTTYKHLSIDLVYK
ncbi:MAG: hypothetical protein IJ897_08820, partial [Prevotella sp.]|nr:hypothetical protein [Prevotella sp.]